MPLAGRPMVEWSIAAFRAVSAIESIVIACPPGYAKAGEGGRPSGLLGDDLTLLDGGKRRAESVANALEAVDSELVAIHDAARPLVTPELIEGVVATVCAYPEADGAIAASPVTDTIKRVHAEGAAAPSPDDQLVSFDAYRFRNSPRVVESTLDRGRLWAAQTPQVFRTDALRRAIDIAEGVASATDEAMLIEAAGGKVLIYASGPENLKVTTPLDLKLAELLLDRADR